MKATCTGFSVSKLNADYKTAYFKVVKMDDVLGIETVRRFNTIVVKGIYLKPFVNKEVEIEVVKSPKLNVNVLTKIKEAK